MKKIVALLLAVAMLATLGLSAFAAADVQEVKTAGNYTAVVKVDEDSLDAAEWWVVKIPADKEIAWGTTSVDMSYGVASQLAEGKTIDVTVTGANALAQVGGSASIVYTPAGFAKQTFKAVNGSRTANDVEPVTYTYSYDAPETAVTLTIAATAWDNIPVAVYQDTLTYNVVVNDAPVAP